MVSVSVTVQSSHSFLAPLPTRKAFMSKEQKLWLCVLLQAIAEQNAGNVTSDHAGVRGQKERAQASADARAFIGSSDFYEICELAGIDRKTALAMSCDPRGAEQALQRLLDKDSNLTGIPETFVPNMPETPSDAIAHTIPPSRLLEMCRIEASELQAVA